MPNRSPAEEPLNKLKSDHDYLVYEAYRDAEFITDAQALKLLKRQPDANTDEIAALTRAIAQEYGLTVAEVNWYLIGRTIFLPQRTASATYNYNPGSGRYYIEFDIDAPKAEIDEAFAQFDYFRKFLKAGRTNRKALFYPDIVYRTFRLRRRRLTFAAVHQELTNPQSPYYDERVRTLFDTPDDLRRHYNKHKPA